MEKNSIIDRVKRFNIVGKQAMSYIEKQYAVDTGFRMINTNLVNFEDTFFLENIIYNELKSRDYEVFTGKTYKGEIDFVAINGRKRSIYIFIKSSFNRKSYNPKCTIPSSSVQGFMDDFDTTIFLKKSLVPNNGLNSVLAFTGSLILNAD